MAAGEGTVQGQARKSSAEQEEILTIMRDATRGYGRGS